MSRWWKAGWAAIALAGGSLAALGVVAAEGGVPAAVGLLAGITALTFGDTLARTNWRRKKATAR